MRKLPRMTPIVVLIALAPNGCAHYGWAGDGATTVAVETVDLRADLGIDGAAVTRHLIDELRVRGHDASWTGSGEVRVRCHGAAIRDDLAGRETAATALETVRLTCEVATPTTLVRVSHASSTQATLGARLATSRQDLRLSAALQAAELVASEVDRTLREQ